VNNIDAKKASLGYLQETILKASSIDTPIGAMLAVGDDEVLYFLQFLDHAELKRDLEKLQLRKKATIIDGVSAALNSVKKELHDYFSGKFTHFSTPLQPFGTPFQQRVWAELRRVPYGESKSYAAEAAAIGRPSAFRAVANANGANPISIIIPCHRIINTNGKMGGYGGGLSRKKWLLEHEKRFSI